MGVDNTDSIAQMCQRSAGAGHCDQRSVGPSPMCEVRHFGVRFWDVAQHRELAALEGHLDTVCSVAFSPGEALLASGRVTSQCSCGDVDFETSGPSWTDLPVTSTPPHPS
jgi:hypothetical protein